MQLIDATFVSSHAKDVVEMVMMTVLPAILEQVYIIRFAILDVHKDISLMPKFAINVPKDVIDVIP